MEDQQNSALLERASSADTLTVPSPRNSNAKAFKVAGLTLLACLLLAGQGLTAYFIMGQRDHITALEQGQENLKNQLTRKASVAPKMMHVPRNSMPLLTDLTDVEEPKQKVPLTRVQSTSFLKEGSGLVDEGSRMAPRMLHRPVGILPLLTETKDVQPEEDQGTETPAIEVESKCVVESQIKVKPGYFQPQCDDEGNFLPMQCWHSTGYCWCVDKHGNEIEGTKKRGRPHCGDVNEAKLID